VVGIVLAVLVYVAIQTMAINSQSEPEAGGHMYIDLDTGEQWMEGEGGVMLEPAEVEIEIE